MQEREKPALRAPHRSATSTCLVMVCNDQNEADQVASLLEQYDSGCLVTYRRAGDLLLNAPHGRVSLVILAGDDTPSVVGRMLKWLRRRWPGCPVTVLGSPESRDLELAARSGGASYLVRPVSTEEWVATVAHALQPAHSKSEDRDTRDYRPV